METEFERKIGEEMFKRSDIMISISRGCSGINPKIKIIRSKFTPASDKEK